MAAPRRLSLKDLSKATDGFSTENFLGEGTFGRVYKGKLPLKSLVSPGSRLLPAGIGRRGSGEVLVDVAVKRLHSAAFAAYKSCVVELGVVARLRHPHLVRVLAVSLDGENAALAFELCRNGSLRRALQAGVADGEALPWPSRVSIASNVARGLAAIHECNIIHRDVKANNILLTERYEAKVSDFSLAHKGPESEREQHVSTKVLGTLGYLDPAYMESGWLTFKSDVYAFGVVLLELITGKQSVNKDGTMLTVEMAPYLSSPGNSILQVVDPLLGGNYSKPGVRKLASLAKSCLHIDPDMRPAMADLLIHLNRVER